MSHSPERKEKICLNCKSVIYGRYCHICGQENLEPKETFWGLITHFVYDITHFDGKFFSTTKYLLFRPGYLAYEYLRGRRASYLNPVRMYVFTSAFFFIIFFSFFSESAGDKLKDAEEELVELKVKLNKQLSTEKDSLKKVEIKERLKKSDSLLALMKETGIPIKRPGDVVGFTVSERGDVIQLKGIPKTVKEYDSIQSTLPSGKKDNWRKRFFYRKIIAVNTKYRNRPGEFIDDLFEKFKHSVPQMMFVSLPLVALIMQLLYISRKQFYYVNHIIFTLNLYIAIFIQLLVYYLVAWLQDITGSGIFTWVAGILMIAMFYYIYKSMRNFYGQRRGKTILKFCLLMFCVSIIFVLLVMIFGVNSLIQVS